MVYEKEPPRYDVIPFSNTYISLTMKHMDNIKKDRTEKVKKSKLLKMSKKKGGGEKKQKNTMKKRVMVMGWNKKYK